MDWLAEELVNVDYEIEHRHRRLENLDAWRKRPQVSPDLSPVVFPVQEEFDVDGLRVVVGAMARDQRHAVHSTLRFFIDDRPFRDLVLIPGRVLGYGVLIAGDLETDLAFSNIVPSPRLLPVALTVARALPDVCLRHASAEEALAFIKAVRGDIGLVGALQIREHNDDFQRALQEGIAEVLRDHPIIPSAVAEELLSGGPPRQPPTQRLHRAITPVNPSQKSRPADPAARLRRVLRRVVLSISLTDGPQASGPARLIRPESIELNKDHPLVRAAFASEDAGPMVLLASSLLSTEIAHPTSGHLTDDAIARYRNEQLRVFAEG